MGAEIITIGTELLLGEIVDTNTAAIARALREIGLDLFRTSTVGDNAERIAQAVRESLARSEVVIASGGLGPTVDDATRQGIAMALGVPQEFRPDLWEQIQERFASFGIQPTDNNQQQAYIPKGAIAIQNPVGTAPAFIAEKEERMVIALPGVPAELDFLLKKEIIPYLQRKLELQHVIQTRVLKTAGMGESRLDSCIHDLEHLANPTVGLPAHPGRVDIRITAKAKSVSEAESMLHEVEQTLRKRLGEAVYGMDQETLESAALAKISKVGWRVAAIECGTQGRLNRTLAAIGEPFAGGNMLPSTASEAEVEKGLRSAMKRRSAQVGLGLRLEAQGKKHQCIALLLTPSGKERVERWYMGPTESGSLWASNLALDLMRRRIP